jgi:hypothetical protein
MQCGLCTDGKCKETQKPIRGDTAASGIQYSSAARAEAVNLARCYNRQPVSWAGDTGGDAQYCSGYCRLKVDAQASLTDGAKAKHALLPACLLALGWWAVCRVVRRELASRRVALQLQMLPSGRILVVRRRLESYLLVPLQGRARRQQDTSLSILAERALGRQHDHTCHSVSTRGMTRMMNDAYLEKTSRTLTAGQAQTRRRGYQALAYDSSTSGGASGEGDGR